ncbi:TetR family transcriptional regulator [Virgibacillus sp. YIM 98842]|uniref:TetR/AcrR family transcriptional regulator n=1 Tax=Virgibacillus sp. YIM 98842 TaxID=2663533 RepID=UPI0013DCCC32|nr:TetR family transcriptional regulator [Virgibacillus sp. YIM 98842]
MSEPKTDPRILRTRKLIMDSFIELSEEKEFKDITIKDITSKAMINRATFYYHFQDIYDLLERALSEVLLINLDYSTYGESELNNEDFVSIFKAIADFQQSLSHRCHRGYEDTIARIIREQLYVIFFKMLQKKHPNEKEKTLKLTATMLSWGIYGASVEWRKNNSSMAPEEFIESAIPFIKQGIEL